jgi:HD-like signal output (HDOD) protein
MPSEDIPSPPETVTELISACSMNDTGDDGNE